MAAFALLPVECLLIPATLMSLTAHDMRMPYNKPCSSHFVGELCSDRSATMVRLSTALLLAGLLALFCLSSHVQATSLKSSAGAYLFHQRVFNSLDGFRVELFRSIAGGSIL